MFILKSLSEEKTRLEMDSWISKGINSQHCHWRLRNYEFEHISIVCNMFVDNALCIIY